MKYSPKNITRLKDKQLFVFGSNEAGRHGKGAALTARRKFGAIYGQGRGIQGQSYAIPTKNAQLEILRKGEIYAYVLEMIRLSQNELKDYTFLVTEIGCGLSGYKVADIAPMFTAAWHLENIVLPESFGVYIERQLSKYYSKNGWADLLPIRFMLPRAMYGLIGTLIVKGYTHKGTGQKLPVDEEVVDAEMALMEMTLNDVVEFDLYIFREEE